MTASRIGRYVQQLRQQRGLGLRQLAAVAGVDPTWLSRLEHGRYESPDPRRLARVAQALDVDPADFYLAAGYGDGSRLPGFAGYLRAKYALPDEAVNQLQAHFDLLNDKYKRQKGDGHDPDHHAAP